MVGTTTTRKHTKFQTCEASRDCRTCGARFTTAPGERSRADVAGPPICEACYGVEGDEVDR